VNPLPPKHCGLSNHPSHRPPATLERYDLGGIAGRVARRSGSVSGAREGCRKTRIRLRRRRAPADARAARPPTECVRARRTAARCCGRVAPPLHLRCDAVGCLRALTRPSPNPAGACHLLRGHAGSSAVSSDVRRGWGACSPPALARRAACTAPGVSCKPGFVRHLRLLYTCSWGCRCCCYRRAASRRAALACAGCGRDGARARRAVLRAAGRMHLRQALARCAFACEPRRAYTSARRALEWEGARGGWQHSGARRAARYTDAAARRRSYPFFGRPGCPACPTGRRRAGGARGVPARGAAALLGTELLLKRRRWTVVCSTRAPSARFAATRRRRRAGWAARRATRPPWAMPPEARIMLATEVGACERTCHLNGPKSAGEVLDAILTMERARAACLDDLAAVAAAGGTASRAPAGAACSICEPACGARSSAKAFAASCTSAGCGRARLQTPRFGVQHGLVGAHLRREPPGGQRRAGGRAGQHLLQPRARARCS
jgi:hypothetical protein